MRGRKQEWKRVVKCALSLGCYSIEFIANALARLFGHKPAESTVVLYYHSVALAERDRFAKQMDILLRYAKPVDVGAEVITNRDIRQVGITFDDGFENFVQCALPELQMRQIPVTVFIICGTLGKMFGPSGKPERLMTAEQLRSLPEDLVRLGSHTLSHPMLPSIEDRQARLEIEQSRLQLEGILGRPISLFSFPFGGFTEKLVSYCREAGYQRVFTTLPTPAFTNPTEFVVGRVRVDPSDWPLEFKLKLLGAYRWLPYAFALKKKLRSSRPGIVTPQNAAASE